MRLLSCGREGFVTDVKILDLDGVPVPKDGRTAGEIVVRRLEAQTFGQFAQLADQDGEIVPADVPKTTRRSRRALEKRCWW